MSDPSSQDFLRELDKKLWNAADRLRSNLDAAVYKHAVLGLVFLKYVSDSFAQHPDLRADFVMALPSTAARSLSRSHPADRPNGRINPSFNISEWWDGKLEGDARWSRSEAETVPPAAFYKKRGKCGTPPQTAMRECAPLKSEGIPQVVSEARDNNANFAWVQHMLHHLAPNGSMALLSKFMIIRASEEIHPRLLYRILTANVNLAEFQLQAESRSGTFLQITFDSISHLPIVFPPMEIQEAYQRAVDSIDARIKLNKEESRTLIALRDSLLPNLLSWELKFSPLI